jgi:hypothetical protein
VGFIAGWFLARIAVPRWPRAKTRSCILQGFGIILACAFTASLAGFGLGLLRGPNADYSVWQDFVQTRGVADLPSFVRVAYIHNASYLGGSIGLIVALVYLRQLELHR